MALVPTYTDPFQYRRAPTGLESDTLLGNLTRLSGSIALGATSLPVSPATTIYLAVDDQITIFDGANSEVVTVTTATVTGSSTILVSATLAAHASKVVICSNGTLGSLADMIVDASAWLENICQQPRWQATFTEQLRAPSMRAAVDVNGAIVIRPRRFPIVSVSSISYQTDPTNVVPLSTAYVTLEQQLITLPVLAATGGTQGNMALLSRPVSRQTQIWYNITYIAGYAPGTIPGHVTEAGMCLVSALLADRQNPTGGAEVQMGKRHLVAYLRGDQSGKVGLIKRAESLLANEQERPI
jgi:hypothetical protein